jgi:hypothetical protein
MNHIKRLSWPLLFGAVSLILALFVGISRTNLEVVIFKFLIFCPSLMLVHLSRKVMFPYIDLERTIDAYDEDTLQDGIRDAAVILGVFLYYVVLTYALTQAI